MLGKSRGSRPFPLQAGIDLAEIEAVLLAKPDDDLHVQTGAMPLHLQAPTTNRNNCGRGGIRRHDLVKHAKRSTNVVHVDGLSSMVIPIRRQFVEFN